MEKVTLIFLTYNRKSLAEKSVPHNLGNAGYPINESIWIDNGSVDGVDLSPFVNVTIKFKENRGVGVGYNTGFRLCRGHAVIPSTDFLLPENWLKDLVESLRGEKVGIACIKWHPVAEVRDGINNGPKIIRHELFQKIGYLHDDISKYGHEDTEYGLRAQRAGYRVIDIKTTGAQLMEGEKDPEYVKFKTQEAKKSVRMLASQSLYFSPYEKRTK